MSEIKCSYDTNRKKLADEVPLNCPLSMYIEPTKKCNFKCFYCMHSTREIEGGEFQRTGYQALDIDPVFYSKLIKDIMQFSPQPQRICFSGLGEPLMNKKLPSMIKDLRQLGYQKRIDIITNGYLLTNDLADSLIDAGVSRIQISIQGLTQEDYAKNCGVNVDIDRLVEQIRYLFENRKNSTVYIKIIDALLLDENQKELFFQTYENICDQIFVEHLIVMQQQMGDHNGKVDDTKNLNNEVFVSRDVCPVCFYHLQVSAEGYTFPCPIPGMPSNISMGNAKKQSLQSIWLDKKRSLFLKKQLEKKRHDLVPCGTCTACAAVLDENENLDNAADDLLKKMEIV